MCEGLEKAQQKWGSPFPSMLWPFRELPLLGSVSFLNPPEPGVDSGQGGEFFGSAKALQREGRFKNNFSN